MMHTPLSEAGQIRRDALRAQLVDRVERRGRLRRRRRGFAIALLLVVSGVTALRGYGLPTDPGSDGTRIDGEGPRELARSIEIEQVPARANPWIVEAGSASARIERAPLRLKASQHGAVEITDADLADWLAAAKLDPAVLVIDGRTIVLALEETAASDE